MMKSEMNIKFESENLKRKYPSKDGCRWQDNITCHTEIWFDGWTRLIGQKRKYKDVFRLAVELILPL